MNRSDSSSVIIAPDRRKHFKQIVEMTGRVFRPDAQADWAAYCKAGYITGSSYDWSASRIALVDGAVASHVGVWRLNLRIGRAVIPFGGIGAVATPVEYRGRGLASALMRDVMTAMADGGCAMSCMFGRRDFYGRYGYRPAFPRGFAMVNIEIARNHVAPPAFKVRRGRMTDLLNARGEIGRVYQRQRKSLSLTAERPVYTRNLLGKWTLHEFRDAGGKLKGYAACELAERTLIVHELGGFETPSAREHLVRQIVALAVACDCDEAKVMVPRTHPIMIPLRRLNCVFTQPYFNDGNAMVAVVNLAATLRCMRGELAARLKGSELAGEDFALNLKVADQAAALVKRGPSLTVASGGIAGAPRVSGDDLPRLLIGSEPPAEVIEAGGMKVTRKAMRLLEALFPATDPRLPDAEYH